MDELPFRSSMIMALAIVLKYGNSKQIINMVNIPSRSNDSISDHVVAHIINSSAQKESLTTSID